MKKVFPFIILIAGCIIPLATGLGYSVLYSFGLAGTISDGFTLQNWMTVARGEFYSSILHSAYIAIVSAAVSAFLAFLFLAFGKRWWFGKHVYRSLFLPLIVPPIVSAFVIYQLFNGAGVLSRLGFHAGLISGTSEFPPLVQDPWAVGIIISHVLLVFPFFLLILLNYYRNEKLHEIGITAETLGAGPVQVFFRLQLPVLSQRFFPVFVLYFIFFLGAYEIPLILGQSSPQMISVLIVEKLQRFNLADIPVAHAMASGYALLCLISITALFYYYRKKAVL